MIAGEKWIELIRRLTAVDSSVSEGTADIAAVAAELGRSAGLNVEIQSETFDGVDNANVILRTPSSATAGKHLLLVSRLDTSDPGEYGHWVRTGANPFNASVDGDFIYGLGVADAKAAFVCKLAALSQCAEKVYSSCAPVVVGTFGQASGTGAIRLIRKKILAPAAVLVGAPTNLRLANKGPGYAKVEISIPFSEAERRHRESHDLAESSVSQNKIFSRPQANRISQEFLDNPVLRLIDYLKNLPSDTAIISIDGGASAETEPDSSCLEVDFSGTGNAENILHKIIRIGDALKNLSAELKQVEDTDCRPSFSTITLGSARTFPEEIKLSGICRLVPAVARDKFDVYGPWLEKLRQECAAAGASFRIVDYKPPFVTDAEGSFFRFLKGVSSSIKLSTDSRAALQCTEANVFRRLGVDCAVFGPGEFADQTHASQERVQISQIAKAVDFYRAAIESYCR